MVNGHSLVNGSASGTGTVTHGHQANGSRVRAVAANASRFTGYRVRLDIFEGPLDLLLFLIRQNRYDIFDVPVAEITDQYLRFLRMLGVLDGAAEDALFHVDFELAGEFMVVAGELLVIKSKMLLPPDPEPEGETGEEADPRFALAQRLLEYQRYKEAAETLRGFHEVRARMFTRPAHAHGNGHTNGNGDRQGNGHDERKVLLMNNVSLFDLLYAFQRVLDRTREAPPALIRREIMTVPDRMRQLSARLRRAGGGCSFAELCEDCELKIEVIVTFLALLELIRRQRVIVEQTEAFGEIRIRGVRGSGLGAPDGLSRPATEERTFAPASVQ